MNGWIIAAWIIAAVIVWRFSTSAMNAGGVGNEVTIDQNFYFSSTNN